MKITDRVRLVLANGRWWPLAALADACESDVTPDQARAEYARCEKQGAKADIPDGEKLSRGTARLVAEAVRRMGDEIESRGEGDAREYRHKEPRMDAYPVEMVPLARIRIDGGTQQRVRMNEELAEEYAENIDQLPPGELVDDGECCWMFDGFHRRRAHEIAGRDAMPCRVRPGTLRDAVLLSVSANAHPGLRRSPDDVARAVETLLSDPEWGGRSLNWIAQTAKVSFAKAKAVQDAWLARTQRAKPEVVKGKDGRTQAASRNGTHDGEGSRGTRGAGRPRSAPTAGAPSANGHAEPAADPTPLLAREVGVVECDEVGIPLDDDRKAAFVAAAERIESAVALVRRLKEIVSLTAASPAGREYRKRIASKRTGDGYAYRAPELDTFLKNLEGAMPYASVCPYCHANHPGCYSPNCDVCGGEGWVTKSAWENAPKEAREAVELLAREVESEEA